MFKFSVLDAKNRMKYTQSQLTNYISQYCRTFFGLKLRVNKKPL